jgi:hypothetical protein
MRDGGLTRVAFIAGWGRSGSTLLERMLARHPQVASVGEMRDIFQRGCLENRRCGCGAPFADCAFWSAVGVEAFGGWHNIDAAALADARHHVDGLRYLPWLAGRRGSEGYERRFRELAGALDRMYAAIARVAGAEVVVDSSKIPTYALLLHRTSSVDLRIVHLVRDSRGVVFSWQKSVARPDAIQGVDYMHRYTTAGASARYAAHNAATGVLRRMNVPYLRLRYEDLVSDVPAALTRTFAFIAPELQPPPINPGPDGRIELAVSHSVDGNPMRFDHGRVALRADDEWRRRMAPGTRRTVTAMTYPLLRNYGYVSTAIRGRAPS